MKPEMKIEKLQEAERYPDLSHLGEFTTDEPPAEDFAKGRVIKRDLGDGLVYFVAANGPEETGNPNSVREDLERYLTCGTDWEMLRLFVRITTADGWVKESNGLYGVESDSDPSHFEEVWAEELAELNEGGNPFEDFKRIWEKANEAIPIVTDPDDACRILASIRAIAAVAIHRAGAAQ